jgi:hypothetical protein
VVRGDRTIQQDLRFQALTARDIVFRSRWAQFNIFNFSSNRLFVEVSFQSVVKPAPAAESEHQKHILMGEAGQYGDLQVFELKGKDARGFDWAVQMSPVDAIPRMKEAEAVNAARVKAYIGGDPKAVPCHARRHVHGAAAHAPERRVPDVHLFRSPRYEESGDDRRSRLRQ